MALYMGVILNTLRIPGMILLTYKFGSDPQILKPQVTNAGRSALWIAAGTGHAAAVQFLLQLSAVSGVKVKMRFWSD